MSNQVLITGGAGFVGSHLADGLLAAGHRVRILDDITTQVHPDGPPNYLSRDVELIRGDVRDPNRLREVLADVDVVYHFAACVGVGQSMYEISRYISVNTQGTAELLQAILDSKAPIRKIVVASSMSIYGEGQHGNPQTGETGIAPGLRPVAQLAAHRWDVEAADGTPLVPEATGEDKPLKPTSVYAVTKRDHEELFLSVGAAYDIPAVALRFFNVYGTRQALGNPYTGVAAIFASALLNGNPAMIFEDGRQSRDFIDVRDLARGVELALTTGGGDGEAINLGTGQSTSIAQVFRTLADGLGHTELGAEVTEQFRAGDIRHCFADTSKARELLGFSYEIPFDRGMGDLLEWLQGQTAVDATGRAREELVSRGLAR
jgi:dTDP-L-rhamnose 4-epimerase